MINEDFDRVVCINLASRKDKKSLSEERFRQNGIIVEWYHPVEFGFSSMVVESLNKTQKHFNLGQPNEFGAAISHYSVIKKALADGIESLFVFEDDALFRKEFPEKYSRYMEELPGDWDMIMLYSFQYEILPKNERVNRRWIRAYRSWSLMAYGMRPRMMEEYIRFQDRNFEISDLVTYKLQERGDLNIYASVPTLCIPDTGISSNIRGSMNYKTNPTVLNLGYSDENYE